MRVVARNLQDRPVLAPVALERIAQVVGERTDGPTGSAGVAFVDDGRMTEFHDRFMNDPSTTDVLSFPDDDDEEYWGDVVVCTDQALRQARELGHPYHLELAILVLHGLLHLRGFDHTVDRGDMRRLEEALRPVIAARGGTR